MGDKGSVLIKEKNVEKHLGFEEQLFTVHFLFFYFYLFYFSFSFSFLKKKN